MITYQTQLIFSGPGRVVSSNNVLSSEVIKITRNGYPMKVVPLVVNPSSQTVNVTAYRATYTKTSVRPSLLWLLLISQVNGLPRTQRWNCGLQIEPGWLYTLTGANGTAQYESVFGDTTTTIAVNLAAQLDVLPLTNATNLLQDVIIEYLANDYSGSVRRVDDVIYKAGYFCQIGSLYYFIDENRSNYTMPSLPTLAGSYNLDDLTLLPGYINEFIAEPAYPTSEVLESPAGTTDIIGDFTDYGTINGDEVMIDDNLGALIFGQEFLDFEEDINIIYKR